MMAPSHMAAAGLIAHAAFNLSPTAVGIAVIASLVPDFDTPKSTLGRIFPFISYPLSLAGHRSITHSFAGAALLAIPIVLAQGYLSMNLLTPFLIGYLSHLLLDIFTPQGCPLLWPIPLHIKLPLVVTGGIREIIFTTVLIVTALTTGAW
ncbi:membrane-bound metal-dependent hydrolase [Desulforamulus reducens MI-1]|uniref:Membrane-bound metal-dependent hydrolase n=1 Tax=Desulforamulus reducens (strain ATCC BAA-1160 / DSM 100696 / MI-1) TaxID=349161 RepID=A4J315_DESRM|nr:metal-dependent hydrolase [Desulforamulus reducens]ABO49468.1 membrane-bound metal-dependent hydrolase [Desulforamulus reducens MI-1]